jgi:hypothetical protein
MTIEQTNKGVRKEIQGKRREYDKVIKRKKPRD